MKGVYKSNLDLDIILSKEDIKASVKMDGLEAEGSELIPKYVLLEGILFDEHQNELGKVMLQKVARKPKNVPESDRVYFVKVEEKEVFIQVRADLYFDLYHKKNITRRIPITDAQLAIDIV